MTFQFTCPGGHLLEGEESHQGQTVQCPECGVSFIIPSLQQGSVAAAPAPQPEPQPPLVGGSPDPHNFPDIHGPRRGGRFDFLQESEVPSAGDVGEIPAMGGGGEEFGFDPLAESSGPQLVHIPCPNGHILQTPRDTMGDDVLCPHCGEQFMLHYKNSQEYQQEKEIRQRQHEEKLGKTWFTWAIIVAAGVVILLIVLIALASNL